MKRPIKIRTLSITNIRGVSEVNLDFTYRNQVKDWVVILGDNGFGKTTILKCLALALGDKDDASAIFKENEGTWVKRDSPDRKGEIIVGFDDGESQKTTETKIVIARDESREYIDNFEVADLNPDRIFAAGYGAGRSSFVGTTRSKYRFIDAIYSLFDYQTDLLDPEVAIRRLEDHGLDRRDVLRKLEKLLLLKKGAITLDEEGLSFAMMLSAETKVPFTAISDGYKSVLTTIADFLGRASQYYGQDFDIEKISGIFLIDELDQHLHPSWQRKIISLFHQQFPNVQFIATTHSPTCALGLTDLHDNKVALCSLSLGEKGTVANANATLPRGKRIDQIMTSSLFNMVSVIDDNTEELIGEFARLSADQNADKSKIKEISTRLDQLLRIDSTHLQELARESVSLAQKNLLDRRIKSMAFNPKTLEYTVKNRIKKIDDYGEEEN